MHKIRQQRRAQNTRTAPILLGFLLLFGALVGLALLILRRVPKHEEPHAPAGLQAPESPRTHAKLPPSLLQRQPVEGAQDKILLTMELCERVNPQSIECWGYVSNLRDESSDVSLYRADVVDGKGNSFNLSSNGQFDFPTGHSFNIPAGSSVKYTIKIPDKDQDAQTLTLYLDVSNPRDLEYTFRDVPVADQEKAPSDDGAKH
jgi:hypothetical protein